MTQRLDAGLMTGKKLAGYMLERFLDQDNGALWFDSKADNGDRAIVYAYQDETFRDLARTQIHGFRTTANDVLPNGQPVFLSIGDHRLMMSSELRDLLRAPKNWPADIAGYEIQRVLGHGFKGITFEVRQRSGPKTPYVLKLTIAEEYSGKTYLPEVDRMVDIAAADRDHFPQIHQCGTFAFSAESVTCELVYFVEDFIPGRTLEQLIKADSGLIDAAFLYHFTVEVLGAVAILQKHDLMHDDLHAGNVQIHEPLTGHRRPYLIDFGSAKPIGRSKKPRDDIRNLASQIAAMTNLIQHSTHARTAYEDRILKACEGLLSLISDDDPMRRPSDAVEILNRFENSFGQGELRQELRHPFDFGNAEEVMDNSLLYELSAKSFPWRNQIEASSHLLVIGPRGCGKTTVFRSLSFKCMADANKISEALDRSYLGLYVSCNREFRLRFSAIEPSILERRQGDVRHYFHLIVLRELLASLAACASAQLLVDADLKAVSEFVSNHLIDVVDVADDIGDSLRRLEAAITREINSVRMALWNDIDSPRKTHQGFLADLANLISDRLSPFHGKTLYLFVDDYTEGKVPQEAQRAINHILFVPNSVYKCKISSEVFGVTLDETYGNFLTQDRDYREWNLGTLYCLTLPTESQKEFLREIVDKRLQLCRYEGTVDSIIGPSQYKEGTLARTLKHDAEVRRERRAKRQEISRIPPDLLERDIQREVEDEGLVARYHGWDTICELCTGDVSNILELLNRMYEECGVKADSRTRINPEQQDAVVEAYSRQYIGKIKGIPKYGERLFGIVDAFGSLSRGLLQDSPWIERTPTRRDPYQLLRIELDEAGTEASNPEAITVWRLLQRYCIFVDADEGRSRRNTLSSRVLLRRIFCPAFRIGLTNSECWTLSQGQWEAFCHDPQSRAEAYLRDVLRRRNDAADKQAELF